MRSIHYFPRYSQPENVVTNNALLLLVRLHEFSRLKFENLIQKLCAGSDIEFAPQWLRFAQQVGTGTSVVDGFIGQDSVKIAVETKLTGAFSGEQLKRHLNLFTDDDKHRLLVLLSPSLDAYSEAQFPAIRNAGKARRVEMLHTSFDVLIAMVRNELSHHDEEMLALVEDFESFCSEMQLLPQDEFTLFVPPCGQSFRDNEELRLYYCPVERNFRKARYLGIYAEKRIRAIGRIGKVVACEVDVESKNVTVLDSRIELTGDERNRILEATLKAAVYDWDIASGHKFYLCDSWAETTFDKVTSGGIWGHRYFDLREELNGPVPISIDQTALMLSAHTWR